MQKLHLIFWTLAAVTPIVASSGRAAERMNPGQWELTVTEGSRTHTSTDCVTPEKVQAVNGSPDDVRAEIEGRAAAMNCTVQNFKIDGDTVSYTTACKTFSMDNTIHYHGDSMETEVTMKGPGGRRVR